MVKKKVKQNTFRNTNKINVNYLRENQHTIILIMYSLRINIPQLQVLLHAVSFCDYFEKWTNLLSMCSTVTYNKKYLKEFVDSCNVSYTTTNL